MKREEWFLFFSFLTVAVPAATQTNDEGMALLQFTFSHPGARVAAMGGAFAGMADDCTTAVTNPAGLVVLTSPEGSVEYTVSDFENNIPWNSGTRLHVFDGSSSSQFRFDFEPRNFPSLTQNISLITLAYPILKNKLVVAGFYNEPLNFEREFQTEGFDIQECTEGINQCSPNDFFLPTKNDLQLRLKDFGVAIGYAAHERIHLGATMDYWNLDLNSQTQRVNREDGSLSSVQSISGNDGKISYRLSALLQIQAPLSIGIVYTRRPEFDVSSLNVDVLFGDQETKQKFKAPDSFVVGTAWRVNESFSLNFDYVRIFYSQLMQGYYNAFFHQKVLERFPANLQVSRDFQKTTLKVDDENEFRIGGEYFVVIAKRPVNLRAGYWREPFQGVTQTLSDPQLREEYDGVGNITNDTLASPFASQSFEKSVNHWTFGTGFAFGQFSVDWAYDYSSQFKKFVITTFLYF